MSSCPHLTHCPLSFPGHPLQYLSSSPVPGGSFHLLLLSSSFSGLRFRCSGYENSILESVLLLEAQGGSPNRRAGTELRSKTTKVKEHCGARRCFPSYWELFWVFFSDDFWSRANNPVISTCTTPRVSASFSVASQGPHLCPPGPGPAPRFGLRQAQRREHRTKQVKGSS